MIRADNSSYIVNDYLIRFLKYLKLRNIFYEAAECFLLYIRGSWSSQLASFVICNYYFVFS